MFVFFKLILSCNASTSSSSSNTSSDDDFFISFTNTSDIKYVKKFPGIFSPQSTGFKDTRTTTTSSKSSDSLYYFISDAGDFTNESKWPVLMMSTIYDSNGNIFSNNENVISAQLPYHVFAANQSYYHVQIVLHMILLYVMKYKKIYNQ